VRFLRVHPLRAADALQLAAAFLAAERRPSSLELVTLDDRLADAARKEGFELIEVVADRTGSRRSRFSLEGPLRVSDCRPVHVRHIVAKSASMNRRGERYSGRDG
jgi:hypothetical protein